MQPLEFTPELEACLRDTTISEEAPSHLLHDFQVMLGFVAQEPRELTKSHTLPLRYLGALNAQLHTRIEHGLTRPQQKSYPSINGLFLLLRASGLTQVDTTGHKPLWVVDPEAVESWQTLSAEERYFSLVESWLMRANPEIISEHMGHFSFRPPLVIWQEFFWRFGSNHRWREDEWIERVRYNPSPFYLALMWLFGIVEVESGAARKGQGWQIEDVRPTEWGRALLALLWSHLGTDWNFWEQLEQPEFIPLGVLQPYLQPYRPAWQQTLTLPTNEYQKGLFIFKVSLDSTLWRRIAIRDDCVLDILSDAILDAFRFDDDHLYRFLYPTRFGIEAEITHPFMDDALRFTSEVRIGDLPAKPGFQMRFNYDFGDNWMFHLLLERIDPPDPHHKQYRIIERKGRAPEQYSSW